MLSLAASLGLLPACGPRIGDACTRDTDCAPPGIRNRTCDRSYLSTFEGKPNQGECIIEDCAFADCPEDEDSVCVQVYSTQFLSVACDPDREDIAAACDGGNDTCSEDTLTCTLSQRPCIPEQTIADACDPHQVCLREGVCADEVSLRSSCRLECTDDGDCRPGYRCERTDADGIYVAPDPDDPTKITVTSICVPDR